jgi:hypothetical protein
MIKTFFVLLIFLIRINDANSTQNSGDQIVECLAKNKAIPETPMFEVHTKQCEQIVEKKFSITKKTDRSLMAPALDANICIIKKVNAILTALNLSAMPSCDQAEEVVWQQAIEDCYPYFQLNANTSIENKYKTEQEITAFLNGLYWGNRGMVASIVFQACEKTYLK